MIEYNKRLTEVDEILKHLSKEEYKKIPDEILDIIKQNKDTNYVWKYDSSKKLKDQDVSDDTIAILSYINMEFLLNKEQKEFVNKLHILNDSSYNLNDNIANHQYSKDLFSKKPESMKKSNNKLISKNKENIFKKIISKIKSIFLNR